MKDEQHPKPTEPAAPGWTRRRSTRWAAGAITVILVAGTGGTAMAAGSTTTTPKSGSAGPAGAANRFMVSGTLVSVGKSSLAFKLADGTVATATLSPSTTYTKTTTVTTSALANGKTVSVTGTTTNGVLAASRIMVTAAGSFGGFGRGAGGGFARGGEGFPGGRGGRGGEGFGAGGFNFPSFGTISGLSGGSFTLTEANKSKVKVTTSASTVVTETAKTTKSGLTVGQTLSIRGTEKSNTVVAAASVSQGNPGFGAFGGGRPTGGAPGGAPPAAA